MGCNFPDDIFFTSLNEIQEWFRKGNSDIHLSTLRDALLQIIPGLNAKAFYTKRCIVAFSKHGKPYIGEVEDSLFVAAVGNGYSAMCSDALGKIAAHLITENNFPNEYSQAAFQPIFEMNN